MTSSRIQVSFTKEVNPRLARRPLVYNGRLAHRGLTSLVKEVAGGLLDQRDILHAQTSTYPAIESPDIHLDIAKPV